MSERDPGWEDQRAFLAVVDLGSLSGAARELGLTQPTVRRRVEALERAVGQPLFARGTNGLVPTDEARRLADHVRRMAFASASFRRAASAFGDAVAGTVRISVSEIVGLEVLPSMLAPIRARFPALDIELALSNASADLLHQEVDVAVRMHPPRQEALIARHVGRIPLGLFASRAYADRHGLPATPEELASHPLIGPDRAPPDRAFADAIEARVGLPLRFAIRTDSHPAQLAAIRAGLGIGVAQARIGDRDLARVLPDLPVGAFETWIVAHEDLRRSARIDAVFGALVEAFRHYCRPGQD